MKVSTTTVPRITGNFPYVKPSIVSELTHDRNSRIHILLNERRLDSLRQLSVLTDGFGHPGCCEVSDIRFDLLDNVFQQNCRN